MIRYILKHIGFQVCLFVLAFGFVSESMASQSQLNAAFARFIKLVHANTETIEQGTKLCVFGSDDISLKMVSAVNSETLEFLPNNLSPKSDLRRCRIVYVAKNRKRVIKYSMAVLTKSRSLTLATFPSFVSDGGMLFIDVGRRNFELTVNSKVFKDSGVRLDSSITGLIVEKR